MEETVEIRSRERGNCGWDKRAEMGMGLAVEDTGRDPPIHLPGELTVAFQARTLELPASRKTRALLAYLTLTRRPPRRERPCERTASPSRRGLRAQPGHAPPNAAAGSRWLGYEAQGVDVTRATPVFEPARNE